MVQASAYDTGEVVSTLRTLLLPREFGGRWAGALVDARLSMMQCNCTGRRAAVPVPLDRLNASPGGCI